MLLFLPIGTQTFLQQLAVARLAANHESQRVQLATDMQQLLASMTSRYPQISFPSAGKPGAPVPSDDGPQETYEPMQDMIQEEVYEDTEGGVPAIEEEIYDDTDAVEPIQEDVYDDTDSIPPRPPPSPRPPSANAGYSRLQPKQTSTADLVAEYGDEPIAWDYDIADVGKKKMKVSDLKSVKMKGTLEKLGGRGQNSWQKRICVLSGSFLYFFEKDSSKTYNNRIVVPGYLVSADVEKSNEKKKHFVFKLHSEGTKNYYFRATSEKDCQKWVAALSAVALMARPPDATPLGSNTMAAVGTYSTLSEASEDEKRDVIQKHPLPPLPPVPGDDGPTEEYEPIDLHDLNLTTGGGGDGSDEEYAEPDPNVSAPPAHLSLPPKPRPVSPQPVTKTPPPVQVDTTSRYPDGHNGLTLPNVYVALYEFYPYEKDELQLQRGDLVHILDSTSSPEWWYGEAVSPGLMKQGRFGYCPSNHLMAAFQVE